MKKFVCFGEILMDDFPTGKVIGGAPLNVAVWLSKFDQTVSVISGVGDDEDGKILLNYMIDNGVDISCVKVNPNLSTGLVKVTVDHKGSASYKIPHPVAWDQVPLTDLMLQKVQQADAFLYSTLPARDAVNFKTISELLPNANYKLFDVNLREPHYKEEIIISFCEQADLIKFNDDELFEVTKMYGFTAKSLEAAIQFIADKTYTPTICVTKGKYGAMVLHEGELTYFSGYRADVIDTVGAGDSFLAAFSAKFLNQVPILESIKFACGVGAFVASSRGANPSTHHGELDSFIHLLAD